MTGKSQAVPAPAAAALPLPDALPPPPDAEEDAKDSMSAFSPVCLPHYNRDGFLHAYIHSLSGPAPTNPRRFISDSPSSSGVLSFPWKSDESL